jgi:predicted nucleic acid-binding protein
MIALDTNLLLDWLVKNQPGHGRVKAWAQRLKTPLATTQTNIGEVLRLLTHPRVFPEPMVLGPAVELLQRLVESYAILILEDPADWWRELPGLLNDNPGLKGNEVFDARIALCLRFNGIREIATFDADFAKYPFLEIVRPS